VTHRAMPVKPGGSARDPPRDACETRRISTGSTRDQHGMPVKPGGSARDQHGIYQLDSRV
jgi:hypothetical protein